LKALDVSDRRSLLESSFFNLAQACLEDGGICAEFLNSGAPIKTGKE
jgi:hypothetical protein